MWNTDSWWWKIAVLSAIVAIRETVRWATNAPHDERIAESDAKPDVEQNVEHYNASRSWIEVLDSSMIAFAFVFFLVLPWILQAFYIPSGSMEDTLRYRPASDRLLVAKWIYHVRDPQRGDVIVFRPPPLARAHAGEDYIKRCMGVPGDVIEIRKRAVWRNGALLREPYVKWSRDARSSGYDMKIIDGVIYSREYSFDGTVGFWQREGQVGRDESDFPLPEEPNQSFIENTPSQPIPAGQFLALGDHRNASSDGHVWGLVPRENFVGKAMCVFWPLQRAGTLDRMSRAGNATTSSTRNAHNPIRRQPIAR